MDMDTDNKNDLGIQSQSQAVEEGGEDNILLKVQDQGGDIVRYEVFTTGTAKLCATYHKTMHSPFSFKIKRKTTFRKLMNAYCKKKCLDLNAVRFW